MRRCDLSRPLFDGGLVQRHLFISPRLRHGYLDLPHCGGQALRPCHNLNASLRQVRQAARFRQNPEARGQGALRHDPGRQFGGNCRLNPLSAGADKGDPVWNAGFDQAAKGHPSECATVMKEGERPRHGQDSGEMTVCKVIEEDAGIDLRVAGDWGKPRDVNHCGWHGGHGGAAGSVCFVGPACRPRPAAHAEATLPGGQARCRVIRAKRRKNRR